LKEVLKKKTANCAHKIGENRRKSRSHLQHWPQISGDETRGDSRLTRKSETPVSGSRDRLRLKRKRDKLVSKLEKLESELDLYDLYDDDKLDLGNIPDTEVTR
jgi:DNA repair exonuclease SbcCD ATPase subunit